MRAEVIKILLNINLTPEEKEIQIREFTRLEGERQRRGG